MTCDALEAKRVKKGDVLWSIDFVKSTGRAILTRHIVTMAGKRVLSVKPPVMHSDGETVRNLRWDDVNTLLHHSTSEAIRHMARCMAQDAKRQIEAGIALQTKANVLRFQGFRSATKLREFACPDNEKQTIEFDL